MKRKISEEDIKLNEKKKEYLKRFQDCMHAFLRIEEQIIELEANEMRPPALSAKGMPLPTTYNNKDLSLYVAEKDKLLSDMIDERHKKITVYHDIFKRIEMIEDEREKTVLTLRYIKGMKWEDISCAMNMEWSWVHRIHAKALKSFELPKEAIESNYRK